jgi:hypothetical protein
MKNLNLYFVPNHHSFYVGMTRATEEMLDYNLWPIFDSSDKPASLEYVKTYKDAFNAMLSLSKFSFVVSMEINVDAKKMILPKRVWGRVCLGDFEICVLQFSHDTRVGNLAFRSLLDWPEKTNIPSLKTYEGVDVEFQKIINWSSVENWETFFRERISKVANNLMADSHVKMKEAKENINKAQVILNAFV